MKKKEKKSIFNNSAFQSIIMTFVFLIAGVVLGGLIEKYKQKTREIVDEKLIEIVIPSPVEFYEKIDQGEVVYYPIKDRQLRYGDEIISRMEVFSKNIELKNKSVLMISSHASSSIDTIKLNKHGLRSPGGGFKEIGFISTRIIVDRIRRIGDSGYANNRYIEELFASCSFQIELKRGDYKVRVESIYCGYLARPKTTVVLTAIRAEDVSLYELSKASEDNKRSGLLDIEFKNKNQTFDLNKAGGIQPSIAGPTANRNQEAQNGKNPCASYEVKYPEAVKGQR